MIFNKKDPKKILQKRIEFSKHVDRLISIEHENILITAKEEYLDDLRNNKICVADHEKNVFYLKKVQVDIKE